MGLREINEGDEDKENERSEEQWEKRGKKGNQREENVGQRRMLVKRKEEKTLIMKGKGK